MKTAFCTLLLCLVLAVYTAFAAGPTLVDPVVLQTDHTIYINIDGLAAGQKWYLSDDYACSNTSNKLVTSPLAPRAVPGVYYLCASDMDSNTTEYVYTGQQAHVITATVPSVIRRSWSNIVLEANITTDAANATLFVTVNNCNEAPRARYNFNNSTFSAGQFLGRWSQLVYCYDAPGLNGPKQVMQYTSFLSTVPLVTVVDNGVTFNRKMFSNAEGPKIFEAVSYVRNDKLYLVSSQNLTANPIVVPMAGEDGIFTVSGNLPRINSATFGAFNPQMWSVFASPATSNTPSVFVSNIFFGVPAFSVDPQVVPVSGNSITVTVTTEMPAATDIFVSLQGSCEGRYAAFPRLSGGRTATRVAFVIPAAVYYICVTTGANATLPLGQITTYSRARTIPGILDRNNLDSIVTIIDEDSSNTYYIADNQGKRVGTLIPDGMDNSFVVPAKYPGPHFDLMYETQASTHPSQTGLYVDLNLDISPDIIPAISETPVTIFGGFGEDTLGPFRKSVDKFGFFYYDSNNKCSSPVDMSDGRVEFTDYRAVTFRGFPPTALDLCTKGQDTMGWIYSGKTLFIGAQGEFASQTVLNAMGTFYIPVKNTDPTYTYSVSTSADCRNDGGLYLPEFSAIFIAGTPAEGTKYYLCFKPGSLTGFAFPVFGQTAVVPTSAYLTPDKITREPINKGFRTVRMMGSSPSVNNFKYFMCPLRSDNVNSCNVACYFVWGIDDVSATAVPGAQRIPLIDGVFVLPSVPEFAKALICSQGPNGFFYETGLTFSVDTGISLLPNQIHRSNDPVTLTIFGAQPTDNLGVAVESCSGPMVAVFGTSRSVTVVPQVSGSHFVLCFVNPLISFLNTLASEQVMSIDVRANVVYLEPDYYLVTGQDRHDIFAFSNSPTCNPDITRGEYVKPMNLGYYKYLLIPQSFKDRIQAADPNIRICVRQQASVTWVPVQVNGMETPTPTPTPTDMPTSIPIPTDFPTSLPFPTDMPTFSPFPTDMPTFSPMPTDMPTSSPMPTDSSSPFPSTSSGPTPMPF